MPARSTQPLMARPTLSRAFHTLLTIPTMVKVFDASLNMWDTLLNISKRKTMLPSWTWKFCVRRFEKFPVMLGKVM